MIYGLPPFTLMAWCDDEQCDQKRRESCGQGSSSRELLKKTGPHTGPGTAQWASEERRGVSWWDFSSRRLGIVDHSRTGQLVLFTLSFPAEPKRSKDTSRQEGIKLRNIPCTLENRPCPKQNEPSSSHHPFPGFTRPGG